MRDKIAISSKNLRDLGYGRLNPEVMLFGLHLYTRLLHLDVPWIQEYEIEFSD